MGGSIGLERLNRSEMIWLGKRESTFASCQKALNRRDRRERSRRTPEKISRGRADLISVYLVRKGMMQEFATKQGHSKKRNCAFFLFTGVMAGATIS